MSDSKKDKVAPVSSENIFRITDELVHQVDKTKKLVLIMIVAVIGGIPISWHLAPYLLVTPDNFRIVGYFTILIALLFLVIGVTQWLSLSRWTKKYKTYKELQKKVDEKLDFESANEDEKSTKR